MEYDEKDNGYWWVIEKQVAGEARPLGKIQGVELAKKTPKREKQSIEPSPEQQEVSAWEKAKSKECGEKL